MLRAASEVKGMGGPSIYVVHSFMYALLLVRALVVRAFFGRRPRSCCMCMLLAIHLDLCVNAIAPQRKKNGMHSQSQRKPV